MSSCLNCEHRRKVYVFSTNSLIFTEAQRYCKNNGGTLARDLDSSALIKLLKCCPGQSFYWIGLKSVPASKCINRNSYGLQWIGSRTCSDGRSLELIAQPVNNNECRAIKMQMRSSNLQYNFNKPKAALELCDKSLNYICQINKATTTRATMTTINHVTRFTETSRKTRALNSNLKIKNKQPDVNEISDTLNFKNRINTNSTKNSFLKNCKDITDSYSSHIGASIGGAVGFNVLIFLLLIALFCYKKKKLEKKHKNQAFVSSGVSYDQTHGSVYWR